MSDNLKHNSILDKVMTASREEILANFNPVEITGRLFRDLSGREQDILRRRFGLAGKKRETLEEIGRSFSVTRERVRQVENAAVKNIKARSDFGAAVKAAELAVLACLERHGGIMAEEHLLERLLAASGSDETPRAHLLFLLEKLTSDRLVKETMEDHFPSWRVDFVNWDKARATLAAVTGVLDNHGWPMSEDDLLSRLRRHEIWEAHGREYGFDDEAPGPILAHLRLSRKIKKNPFGEWGLAHWPTVSPKRMGDKIYLVLKKHASPLHFREIAEQINQVGFNGKKAYAPTVHNELILDKRYVLVGRGIYALSEWGYAPGVVGDVAAAVLRKADGPLSREEIIEEVLKQRLVKRGTVYLALSNQNRFRRDSEGNYHLAE